MVQASLVGQHTTSPDDTGCVVQPSGGGGVTTDLPPENGGGSPYQVFEFNDFIDSIAESMSDEEGYETEDESPSGQNHNTKRDISYAPGIGMLKIPTESLPRRCCRRMVAKTEKIMDTTECLVKFGGHAASAAGAAVVNSAEHVLRDIFAFVRWRLRYSHDTKRVRQLRFLNNGIQDAAINLTPPEERRALSQVNRADRPGVAITNCLRRHEYPTSGYDEAVQALCLRLTLGRSMPAAVGVHDSDEELVKALVKSGEYPKFKHLATRIALKECHKLGSEVWEEYKTTDHYARFYRNWWGNVMKKRKRHTATIEPHDVKVSEGAREVLFAMLFIASAVAPECASRLKTEQARAKIVLIITQNLQGQVSQAGKYVAAGWAADIVCAMLDRPSF